MQGITKVVVGIDLAAGNRLPPKGRDLAPACRAALDQALKLARTGECRVHAVYVVEVDDAARDLLQARRGRHSFLEAVEHRLDELLAPARVEGAAFGHTVAFGRPWKVLLDTVAAERADALVAGMPIRGSSEDRALGSNALELLRMSPVPVWIARPGARERLRTVVAAVDGDAAAPSVMRHAALIAAEHGAALEVVNVVDDTPERLLRADHVGDEALTAYRESRMESAHAMLVEAIQRHARGISLTRMHVLRGSPAPAIAEFAQAAEADLVVLGKVPHGTMTDARPGPTAERLVGLLATPLLMTCPRGSAGPAGREMMTITDEGSRTE